MKVSLLNKKILFQKSAVVSDAIGNHKKAWEDYYSCFATIGAEGGNEKGGTLRCWNLRVSPRPSTPER